MINEGVVCPNCSSEFCYLEARYFNELFLVCCACNYEEKLPKNTVEVKGKANG